MITDPARAMYHYPTMEDNLLVCNNYIDASYMIAFAYPTILIVVCTIYAILTRKIPEAFNESKHIGRFNFYINIRSYCIIYIPDVFFVTKKKVKRINNEKMYNFLHLHGTIIYCSYNGNIEIYSA